MIPFTGVTLPFISMGGTSMVVSGLMAGMLVAAQSPVFKAPKKKKQEQKKPQPVPSQQMQPVPPQQPQPLPPRQDVPQQPPVSYTLTDRRK